MASRQWEYVKRERAILIAKLGGRCEKCGTTEKLEFDHKYGKDYESSRLSSSARMARYKREHERGELRLLCSRHNLEARARNDNGQCIPTKGAAEVPRTGSLGDNEPF